jgi:hypothetical protein
LYSIRSKLLPESKSSTTVVLSGSLAVCSAVLDVKKNKSKFSTKVHEKAVFRIWIWNRTGFNWVYGTGFNWVYGSGSRQTTRVPRAKGIS